MSAVADRSTDPTPLLRVEGLSKTFPGLKALDDVSFSVGASEIVAVVGHNGSGKSTLVKILADVYQPDPGATIEVRDVNGNLLDDAEARKGLHFIHQDLGLISMLTTIENMGLGRSARGRGLGPVRTAKERDEARRLIARFGAQFDPTVPVALLSPAERAIVAIARAMDGWTRAENVLVLDEPTTAFHGDEVEVLFGAVRHVAAQGAGVMFISHRLDEVLGLADRVIALRDGRVVADQSAASLDHDQMVQLIAGRAVANLDVNVKLSPTACCALERSAATKCRRFRSSLVLARSLGSVEFWGPGVRRSLRCCSVRRIDRVERSRSRETIWSLMTPWRPSTWPLASRRTAGATAR